MEVNVMLLPRFLLFVVIGVCRADYPCVCNYGEPFEVYGSLEMNFTIGVFNVSECKAIHPGDFGQANDFYVVHFQHQVGFVEPSVVNKTTCPGDIPSSDIVLTTPLSTTTLPTTGTTVMYEQSVWPSGTYGLMRTAQGCPDGTWQVGWRQQDSEDFGTANDYSSNIEFYLAGSFDDNVLTEYCMKTFSAASAPDWPAGSYCILKKRDCPTGFKAGYIFWDDEDIGNINGYGGTLPDGEYDHNTKIYYCCRDDGATSTEIALPTSQAFVLLRYGRECQRVRDLEVQDVFVKWDDDDLFSSSESGGMHPLDEGSGSEHILHFCYYHNPAGIIIG